MWGLFAAIAPKTAPAATSAVSSSLLPDDASAIPEDLRPGGAGAWLSSQRRRESL